MLLVGDASGYVDALTGEGIAVSLACAAALVEAVAVGPRRYERSWGRETRRYRMITETLLWARRRRRWPGPSCRPRPGYRGCSPPRWANSPG